MKNVLKNIILTVIVVISILALGEILVRHLNVIEGVDQIAFHKGSENPILLYELAPNTSSEYADSIVKINSEGLRDYEYRIKKPDNTFRIVVLGDSMVFGYGLDLEDTFPKFLERKLNA